MPLHMCGVKYRNPTQRPAVNVNDRHVRVTDRTTGERKDQVFIGRVGVHLVDVGEAPQQRDTVFIGPHVFQEELAAIGSVPAPAMAATVTATVAATALAATTLAATVTATFALCVAASGGGACGTDQLCIRRIVRGCHG